MDCEGALALRQTDLKISGPCVTLSAWDLDLIVQYPGARRLRIGYVPPGPIYRYKVASSGLLKMRGHRVHEFVLLNAKYLLHDENK